MKRKATKQSRSRNTEEKRYHDWIKQEQLLCVACSRSSPLILHHCMGSSYKHNKILIGHWFCIGLCNVCDHVITNGSRRAFKNKFGLQSNLWSINMCAYTFDTGRKCPDYVKKAILDCNE